MTNAEQRIILLVIACGSAWLLLANLGNQYLWSDEAQTALVSKTILTEGVPRGYDGKNFFSQESGAEYGKNYLWRWHTWLPFYVVAGFYKVFGITTFTSRLPFALFGLGTVLLTYYFTKALWPGGRAPAIAAALLAVSVPFLLLCRQCRYYSMAMFFSMLALYAYVMLMEKRKYAAVLLFISMTMLFHSQHIYVAVIFAVVLLHAIIFHRDRLKILLVAIVVTIAVNAPWLVWLAGMNYAKIHGYRMLNLPDLAKFVWISLSNSIRYEFPPYLLAVLLIVALTKRIRTGRFFSRDPRFWEKLSLPVFFVMFNIIAIAITSPFPFFRYIAPSIPLTILLVAVIIDAGANVHWFVAAATVVVMVATSQLKGYLYEITHDYNGPEEGIALYLNEHGSTGDIVAITYGDMSLKFYTKMRIMGGLTGEDLEPAKNARWVIIRKYAICDKDVGVRDYLLQNIDWAKYRQIIIDYYDIPFENSEDLSQHYFRTCTNEEKVVIYERIN